MSVFSKMKCYLQELALFLIHYAVAIQNFSSCPSAALRGLIGNKTCPQAPKHYHCLETVQSIKDFLQICIEPERIEEGNYPVFQDSRAKFIFPKTCMSNRYQPMPMFTYERNECWYEKSSCTEEGQIIFSNGSAIDDRTCRCDYTKGYTFISTPVNKCYCVPSKEDCSCYKIECLKKSEVLNADYMCSTVKDNGSCPAINSTEYPDIPKKKINNTDINSFLFSNQDKLLSTMIIIIIVLAILLILLSSIFIIYYEYDERISNSMCSCICLNQQCSDLKITEELENIIFKESDSVLFQCTVSKKKSRATWFKDGKQIQTSDVSCRRYICQSVENSHSLKIEKASLQDIGTYTVIIKDKCSCAMLSKEEESSKPESVPSMENTGKIVDLQSKKEHIEDVEHLSDVRVTMEDTKPLSNEQDDGEHLSAAKKVIMGNTKPLPNEQQEKTEITDANTCASENNLFEEEIGTSQKESPSLKNTDIEIYDAVIVCETEDTEEAEEFVRHIQDLDKEWQLDIKIELSCLILQKGGKISSAEKLFDIARFIFIFCTEQSSSKVTERVKNETLLVKSLLDSDTFYRVIPVSVDGPKCIPFEFISLIPINYYSFKQTKEKGIEDKVYIRMLQRLFQNGRIEHLPN